MCVVRVCLFCFVSVVFLFCFVYAVLFLSLFCVCSFCFSINAYYYSLKKKFQHRYYSFLLSAPPVIPSITENARKSEVLTYTNEPIVGVAQNVRLRIELAVALTRRCARSLQ